MKIEKSEPFSSGTEYEVFLYNWCERCVHYKLREDDGFPEFPENGGCRILDAMERARFDRMWWPCKKIVTEKDDNGNVRYWHKCTSFMRSKRMKHAHWIIKALHDANGEPDFVCSSCFCISPTRGYTRYCPNCGAKMDEEEKK